MPPARHSGRLHLPGPHEKDDRHRRRRTCHPRQLRRRVLARGIRRARLSESPRRHGGLRRAPAGPRRHRHLARRRTRRRLRAVPRTARAFARTAHHFPDRARQRARRGVGPAPRRRRFPDQGSVARASHRARKRAVPPRRRAAPPGRGKAGDPPRRAHARQRTHVGRMERPGGAAVADRVLDRLRAHQTSRAT